MFQLRNQEMKIQHLRLGYKKQNEDFARTPEAPQENETEQIKRLRGRPKIIRKNRRGRPIKVYNTANTDEVEPKKNLIMEEVLLNEVSIKNVLDGDNSNEWLEAISDEIAEILKNKTWILVDKNGKEEVVGSQIILQEKVDSNGILQRRKARLVAKRFSQTSGNRLSKNLRSCRKNVNFKSFHILSRQQRNGHKTVRRYYSVPKWKSY